MMSPDFAAVSAPDAPATATFNHRAAVLVVDDDDLVRTFVRTALTRAGYAVTVAPGGEQALALFRAEPGRFDLILTDVQMPRVGGVRLAAEVRAVCPEARLLFMSGCLGGPADTAGIPAGCEVLQKPFGIDCLVQAVGRALGSLCPAGA
jgi:two-component system cell cycle sensor histidine kinase/response regulator CckA